MQIEISLLAIALTLMLTAWIRKRRRQLRIFKELGIPGPEPNLILGNLKEINELTLPGAVKEWRKKYGKQFGFLKGPTPNLVVMDTDLLKQILIKNFSNFVNRGMTPGQGTDKNSRSVFFAEDDRWKKQRSLITPTFSSGKLKQMIPHMNRAIDILLKKIESCHRNDDSFDIYDMFKGLTLDVISRTAFGVETNVQTNPEDPFLLGIKEISKGGAASGLLFATTCFPELSFLVEFLLKSMRKIIRYYRSTSQVFALVRGCYEMIRLRRADPKNRREDFLQLLLDAKLNTDIGDVAKDSLAADYEPESKSTSENVSTYDTIAEDGRLKRETFVLTESEVMANTLSFIFAGFESTSTSLGFLCHVLVNHPEIQQKLREEISKIQDEDGKIDYAFLNKLTYMDMVISEVLRLYSPFPNTVRNTNTETTLGKLQLPKNLSIIIPIKELHYDPDYWTDPNEFIPERFAPENRHKLNLMAYQPFGAGPRNCVARRFALMQSKLAMARVLSEYRLVPCDKTEIGDLETRLKAVITVPKNGVFVKAEKI